MAQQKETGKAEPKITEEQRRYIMDKLDDKQEKSGEHPALVFYNVIMAFSDDRMGKDPTSYEQIKKAFDLDNLPHDAVIVNELPNDQEAQKAGFNHKPKTTMRGKLIELKNQHNLLEAKLKPFADSFFPSLEKEKAKELLGKLAQKYISVLNSHLQNAKEKPAFFVLYDAIAKYASENPELAQNNEIQNLFIEEINKLYESSVTSKIDEINKPQKPSPTLEDEYRSLEAKYIALKNRLTPMADKGFLASSQEEAVHGLLTELDKAYNNKRLEIGKKITHQESNENNSAATTSPAPQTQTPTAAEPKQKAQPPASLVSPTPAVKAKSEEELRKEKEEAAARAQNEAKSEFKNKHREFKKIREKAIEVIEKNIPKMNEFIVNIKGNNKSLTEQKNLIGKLVSNYSNLTDESKFNINNSSTDQIKKDSKNLDEAIEKLSDQLKTLKKEFETQAQKEIEKYHQQNTKEAQEKIAEIERKLSNQSYPLPEMDLNLEALEKSHKEIESEISKEQAKSKLDLDRNTRFLTSLNDFSKIAANNIVKYLDDIIASESKRWFDIFNSSWYESRKKEHPLAKLHKELLAKQNELTALENKGENSTAIIKKIEEIENLYKTINSQYKSKKYNKLEQNLGDLKNELKKHVANKNTYTEKKNQNDSCKTEIDKINITTLKAEQATLQKEMSEITSNISITLPSPTVSRREM